MPKHTHVVCLQVVTCGQLTVPGCRSHGRRQLAFVREWLSICALVKASVATGIPDHVFLSDPEAVQRLR
jgi:hypothetical protein